MATAWPRWKTCGFQKTTVDVVGKAASYSAFFPPLVMLTYLHLDQGMISKTTPQPNGRQLMLLLPP